MTTDTFTFDRSFPLPAGRMFTLMTDAKMRELWGAPGDATLDMLDSDMQVGGLDHHRCGPADAPDFEVETRWYNIDAPTAATYTEVIQAGGMRLGASLVTYALTNTPTGCDATITVAVVSFVGPDMIGEFRDGWTGGLAKLDGLAAGHTAS